MKTGFTILSNCALLAWLSAAWSPGASAQSVQAVNPFADPTNLTVLPKTISPRELSRTMKSFTQALGVRCTHCHVGEEGQSLSEYDFASDEKAAKEVARGMMQMVEHLNRQALPAALGAASPSVAIQCVSCHRGQRLPQQLEDRLQQIAEEQGTEAAIAEYWRLRDQYYGQQGLDFSDQPLIALAERSYERQDLVQSRAWLDLALELNPRCEQCLYYRARQRAVGGDLTGALSDIRAYLEIRPESPPGQALLLELEARVASGAR